MKNLYEESRVKEIQERLKKLSPDSKHLWGQMTASQMLVHCSKALKMAMGEMQPPRMIFGRMIGFIVKPLVFRNDEPMRRNSATIKGLQVQDHGNLDTERERLSGLIDRFSATDPKGLTKYYHSFFGRLTPKEWAILMYKHLDHHLRQFGV